MKKVVLACDGINFPDAAMQCVKQFHAREPLMVTALIFSKVNYMDLLSAAYAPSALPLLELKEEEKVNMETCIATIEAHCVRNDMDYRIHRESHSWNPDDIIVETRFADLLVIGVQSFFYEENGNIPNEYTEQLLHRSECPVLLVPTHYQEPSRVIIAYDGKTDCMMAMKHFICNFPDWTSIETEIVYIHPEKEKFPYSDYLKEYAGKHFPNLTFKSLPFNKEDAGTYMSEQQNVLVVTGSYGRSGISTALKSSFIKNMMAGSQVSLFMAHGT